MEARKIARGDVKVLAAVLARAFHDDPISEFIFPSENSRPRALERFFAVELGALYFRFGETWTTNDLAGAAIWAPPGDRRPRLRDLLPMVKLARFVAAHPARTARVIASLEKVHPGEPHYYLATLGTDPPKQGRGVGSALLKPVLDACDRQGIAAYLESSKERNVPFYRRHGFEVIQEFKLPLGGPSVWLMWRNPNPAR